MSSEVEVDRAKISLLDGSNYQIWAMKMSRTLKAKELWKIVKGEEQRPYVPTKGATNAQLKAQSEWDKRDVKATAIISNAVADSQGQHLLECTTAQSHWEKLCKMSEGSCKSRQQIEWL